MKETIMMKEIKEQPNIIKECHNYNINNLKQIAKQITNFNPTNFIIVGRGTSLHAGYYAKYLLELYTNIPVSIASPSISTLYKQRTNYSNSVVIAISQSGEGLDTIEVIKNAQKQNTLIIVVTNELHSPLAHLTPNILYCNAKKAESNTATKTLTTTLYLITTLIYYISDNNKLNIDINSLSNIIRTTINTNLNETINTLSNYDNLMILSRGYTLSLAMELSLKLKEACLMYTNAYSTAEFYHGPIVIINEHRPVLIFAIDKNTNDNAKKVIEDLECTKTILITNDKELLNIASLDIFINNSNDMEAFFEATIILQLITEKLSQKKNTNPDYNIKLEEIKTY